MTNLIVQIYVWSKERKKGLVEVKILFKEPLNCLLLLYSPKNIFYFYFKRLFYPNNLSNEQIWRNKLGIKTKLYQISNMLWCIMLLCFYWNITLRYYVQKLEYISKSKAKNIVSLMIVRIKFRKPTRLHIRVPTILPFVKEPKALELLKK